MYGDDENAYDVSWGYDDGGGDDDNDSSTWWRAGKERQLPLS